MITVTRTITYSCPEEHVKRMEKCLESSLADGEHFFGEGLLITVKTQDAKKTTLEGEPAVKVNGITFRGANPMQSRKSSVNLNY